MTDKKHGGNRKGAGRPATGKNETTVVRVDAALIPIISKIREQYKKTKSLDNLINVTSNQGDKELADLKQANVDLVLKYDTEHLRAVKLEGDIRGLILDIEKIEARALVDQATIDRLIAQQNSKESTKGAKNNHAYDGNAKGFRAEIERVTGISPANRSKFAGKLKSTYAAVGITPKKNGRLSSDAERLAVYEWLKDNL